MKTRSLVAALALTTLPFLGGCAADPVRGTIETTTYDKDANVFTARVKTNGGRTYDKQDQIRLYVVGPCNVNKDQTGPAPLTPRMMFEQYREGDNIELPGKNSTPRGDACAYTIN